MAKREDDQVWAAERDYVVEQMRGRSRNPVGRRAHAVLHTVATHPDHGEEVVFVPGELLPDWAAQALDSGRLDRDAAGITRLDLRKKATP
jgi:hypothetical protein